MQNEVIRVRKVNETVAKIVVNMALTAVKIDVNSTCLFISL